MLCDYRPSTGLYRQGEECVWSIFDEVKMWITVIVERQSPANHWVMFMVEQKHFTRLERVRFAFLPAVNNSVTSLAFSLSSFANHTNFAQHKVPRYIPGPSLNWEDGQKEG